MTQPDLENPAPSGSDASKEELQITHEWARRRLELYDRMERAIRDEISYALRSAADIRSDVEKDADAYMRRADLDRFFIIAAHTHRECRNPVALGNCSEQCEMR